ncbi:protein GrpE [Chryseobacterium sp. StRB126]|uniref:hypothetical protein n=1 Tax=Chryseobacterium sp. StRB126 TaxID=878220 RepID=UPI0004E98B0D|nr:hypothetical protein [Chryseobacterium sp. StRB126]BAP30847.1 protein GrpE [Chryseobacterium sp. StRB126]
MRNILTLLLLLTVTTTFAQSKKFIIEELNLSDPLQTIVNSNYNKIKLQDIRTNPDDYGIVMKGVSDRKAKVRFSPSFEEQLTKMFDKGIDKTSAKDQELLIQLRSLNYKEVTIDMVQYGYFNFRALIFGGKENQYQLIKKIDTTMVLFKMDVTKKLEEQSLDYLHKTVFDAVSAAPIDHKIYTQEDINNYDRIAKSQLPLYTQSKLKDGVYLNYKSFSTQVPDKSISEIQVNLGMITKVTYIDDKGKKRNAKTDSYAVVTQGKAYIMYEGELYPMRKTSEDFYFISKIYDRPTGERQLISGTTGAMIGGPIGGVIGVLIAGGKSKTYECQLDYFNGKYEIVREIKPQKLKEVYHLNEE